MKTLKFFAAMVMSIAVFTSCSKDVQDVETPKQEITAEVIAKDAAFLEAISLTKQNPELGNQYINAALEGFKTTYPSLTYLSLELYNQLLVDALKIANPSPAAAEGGQLGAKATCPTWDACFFSCCYWAVYFGQLPYNCYGACY